MKLKQLIEKADMLFNTEDYSQKKQKKSIKKVLKKLRKHEKKLAGKLQDEVDPEVIEKLEKKLALAHAHRKKGIQIINDMNEEKDL